MIKRVVVTGLKARGYVDGRYVGEEKKEPNSIRDELPRGRKRRGKAGPPGAGVGRGKKRGGALAGAGADNFGNTTGSKRGKRGKAQGRGARVGPAVANVLGLGNAIGQPLLPQGEPRGPRGQPRGQARKNTAGKRTPFRKMPAAAILAPSPSQVGDMRRVGEQAKSGQFAEALAAQANVKRERLHKVMAQSGIGSRRDMEIMISTGRVMVNGIVATTGTQVSPGDNVLVDQRPVKLKFSEELPRILLYHKPEGEIVTTSDPGNRITVFDNLPPVENGKWIAIGRLDINTSGLLIFTTNGELANRFMHPRYEVEREYAVRILGELTDEQTQALLSGVSIDTSDADADEDGEDLEPSAPARFDTIEKRGGEGANQWYHVTIKEGRNREVRKMFESQGLTVSRLIRTRFGKIELPPRLSRGKLMELTPDQVRSILAGAGMKEEADIALPPARGGRGARPGKPPREGQPPGPVRTPPGPGRQGPRPPRDGNTGDTGEPGNAGDRPRRNRRGGKGARREGMPPATVNGIAAVQNVSDEGFGNRVDSGNDVPAALRGDAQPHFDGGHETAGNVADAAGNLSPNAPAERGPKPPGKNPRSRQRRNFRGRGGRNRGARHGPGEGTGGDGGNAEGGAQGGNTDGGSQGGGNDGNRGDSGGNNNGGNGGGNEGNF